MKDQGWNVSKEQSQKRSDWFARFVFLIVLFPVPCFDLNTRVVPSLGLYEALD
jgi:hypothetical protein